MDECRSMGIVVKGPDVNESVRDFGVTSAGDIRFGLSAISGIGDTVVDEIVKARGDQPFADIYDFVERVPSSSINRRVFENLALAGAFDCFGNYKREDLVNENSGRPGDSVPEMLLRYGAMHQNAQRQSQATLFDFDDEQLNTDARPPIVSAIPWRDIVRLDKERDLIGMYLSAHPLDPYYLELNYGVTCTLGERDDLPVSDGLETMFGGIVTERTERTTRQGRLMMVVKIEDFTSSTEFVLFEEQMRNFSHLLAEGQAVIIRGVYKANRSGDIRFNLTAVHPLDQYKGKMLSSMVVKLAVQDCNDETITMLTGDAGDRVADIQELPLQFVIYDPEINRNVKLSSGMKIKLGRRMIERLKERDMEFNVEKNK